MQPWNYAYTYHPICFYSFDNNRLLRSVLLGSILCSTSIKPNVYWSKSNGLRISSSEPFCIQWHIFNKIPSTEPEWLFSFYLPSLYVYRYVRTIKRILLHQTSYTASGKHVEWGLFFTNCSNLEGQHIPVVFCFKVLDAPLNIL